MSEDSGGLSNSNDDELQEVIGENLPATINGDDEELQEEIGENLSATINGDDEEQRLVEAKKLQEKCLRLGSPVSPARLYCCYAVITVLTAVVIALSFALSLSGKTKQVSIKNTYATCPRNWIGFGNKCFYFSEDLGNQTFSQNYCIALKAQLARFDNQEELSFLKRYKGPSDHWIGLHRESSHHPWMWTDNTEYNNLFPTRGEGPHAYLSDRGISSGRDYIRRRHKKPYIQPELLHCTEAQLARFDNQEELSFLKRYKGPSDHWIGLHRESSHYPWMWTDNTEYNNLFPTREEGKHTYLSDSEISSGRNYYIRRRWIYSKPYSYALQCPGVSQLV